MTTDHIDWQAFCYAAGELDADSAEQFEAQLADDQQAREALARAVELTQTVAAAESQCGEFATPASRTVSGWNTRVSWMAVGGLASLLLALLWSGVVDPTWRTAQRQLTAGKKQSLALAWNETGHKIASVKASGLWPTSIAATEDDELDASEMNLDESSLDEAPSWMMAAVFNAADETGGDDRIIQ